jgi:hypothetical protein
MYERNQKLMTEVGVSESEKFGTISKTHHLIIEENLTKRNGKFVPDHSDKFCFGDSE